MPVIHSQYRDAGTVSIDSASCRVCGQCAKVCATGTLVMEDGNLRINTDAFLGCIACGQCMMVCPEDAISVTGRGINAQDIIPLPGAGQCSSPDALEALLRSRRSIRRFTDREVEPAILDRIIDIASTAPMGIPPWDVGCVVIRGRKHVRELSDQVIDGYQAALRMFKPWVLSLIKPFSRTRYEQFATFIRPLALEYVTRRQHGEDALFYDAPAVLIFHASPYADAADAIIPCTYAMLAAQSLGLGTTMIGAAAPIIQRNRKLSAQLGIPKGNRAMIALIIGHPAVTYHKTIRRRFSHMTRIG